MFIIKTGLLISLLCVTLSVSTAAVVPVEDALEERADVSVPVITAADVQQVAAEPAEKDVKEERAELSVSDATAQEEPLKDNTPQRYPSNCPQRWQPYKDNCYLLVNLTYSWHNAEFLCESLGSSLASVHSLLEYSFLQQLTRTAGFSTAWLGGYRFQGYWRWDDGTPFYYKNWYSHSSSSSYECLHLNTEGPRGWSNQQCHMGHPFFCSLKRISC